MLDANDVSYNNIINNSIRYHMHAQLQAATELLMPAMVLKFKLDF